MCIDAKFWVEIISAFTVPITIGLLIYQRIKKEQGLGYRVLQFLAIGVITPIILILALEGMLMGETVAALIGSIVAYLFTSAIKESKQVPRNPKS